LRGKTCNRQTNFFVEGREKYGTCIFKATSSIVSAVSSFVAKRRQTMHHVSASPFQKSSSISYHASSSRFSTLEILMIFLASWIVQRLTKVDK
jgi:hypothetical protein